MAFPEHVAEVPEKQPESIISERNGDIMMKNAAKKITAVLLIMSFILGILPTETVSRQLQIFRAKAGAEEARASHSAETMEMHEEAFRLLAEEAREMAGKGETADDGEWQYVILPESGYAVITGHRDHGTARVNLPAVLGGADVVAALSGTFAGHAALEDVQFSANMYYADSDTLPRGVGVRGYHGSYAQYWAEKNRHAFENLSEYDFVTGVADLTDIDVNHVERISASEVRMRELEASRLRVGSVFFWIDPDQPYTVSYYRVTGIAREEGWTRFSCETPEIADLLNSYHIENAPMVLDPSSVQTAEGVKLSGDSSRKQSKKTEGGLDLEVTPHFNIGKRIKVSGALKYKQTTELSLDYSNLELHSYTKKATEEYSMSLKVEVTVADTKKDIEYQDPETYWKLLQVEKSQEADLVVGRGIILTLAGIVSLETEIRFRVKVKSGGEVSYSVKTETTERYSNGNLVSTSEKKPPELSLKLESSAEIGFDISLKLLLGPLEVASASLFAGLRIKAEFKAKSSNDMLFYQLQVRKANTSAPGSQEYQEAIQSLENYLQNGGVTINDLNMQDCTEISVNVVLEVSAKVGNDWIVICSKKWTLLDWEIAKFHFHLRNNKFVYNGQNLSLEEKSFEDHFHLAAPCPLSDRVYLMVPKLDNSDQADAAFGTVDLLGRTELNADDLQLDLLRYGYRVNGWYHDRKLTKPVNFPVRVKVGDRLYAAVEEVKRAHLVNYAGEELSGTNGEEIAVYLALDETLNTASLLLPDRDHLVGWYKVNNADSLTITDSTHAQVPDLQLTGNGNEQTWMAVYDNDLTLRFFDGETQLGGDITWGHNIEFPEKLVPVQNGSWDDGDGHYGTVTYTWTRKRPWLVKVFNLGANVTFPHTFRDKGAVVDLAAASTTVIHQDSLDYGVSGNLIGGENVDISSMHLYNSEEDYIWTPNEDDASVTITGFRKTREVTGTDGNQTTVTIEPQAISVPARIEGKTVTAIGSSAFRDLTALIYAKLPASINIISMNAFMNCTALKKLDLGACTSLTSLPYGFARNDRQLRTVILPDSLTSIEDYAFSGCTSISRIMINAALGSYVFQGCTSLSEVKLGRGVTSIEYYTFKDCTSLTALTIPCTTKFVGQYIISGCTGLTALTFDGTPEKLFSSHLYIGPDSHLTELTIRRGVNEIGTGAFANGSYGHPFLTDISLPNAAVKVSANILEGTAVKRLHVYNLNAGSASIAAGCTTLEEITFENGTVGQSTFEGCTSLTTVTMGKGVYGIGDCAFKGCTSLRSITLGENVLQIGEKAFYGCTGLELIQTNDKIEIIRQEAFSHCSALKKLVIPASVHTLEEWYLLYDCNALEELTIGGPGYPKLNASLHLDEYTPALRTVTIQEGVTEIEDGTFDGCSYLETAHLPDSLKKIGDNAFSSTNLQAISIPAAVREIGDYAFCGCKIGSLTMPANSSLEILGNGAFAACVHMTSADLSATRLKVISESAFASCTGMTSMILPESVTEIEYEAFCNCESLKTINIPASVRSIGEAAFEYCQALTSDDMKELHCERIGFRAFAYCKGLTELSLAKEVKILERYAFYFCENLKTLKMSEGLVSIGECAFEGCHIEGVDGTLSIPSTVSYLGDNCFQGTGDVRKLIAGGPACPTLYDGWFASPWTLSELVIRDGVTELEQDAFSYHHYLRKVQLPDSLEVIGERAFYDCGWLDEIRIPSSVRSIGDSAFSNCNLSQFEFTRDSQLETIGDEAFSGCYSLPSIELPSQVRTIGNSAFKNCAWMETIGIGSMVQSIGNNAFESCWHLKTLILPSGLKNYGDHLIDDCVQLETLIVGGSGCPEIPSGAFQTSMDDAPLKTIIIGEGVTSIGDEAFANNNAGFGHLTELSLPSTLERIGDYAFRNAEQLREVYIPENTVVSDTAFSGCTNFRRVSGETWQLTVLDGETVLYEGNQTRGEDLTALLQQLAGCLPTDRAFRGWRLTETTEPLTGTITMPAFNTVLYVCEGTWHTVNLKLVRNGITEDYDTVQVCNGETISWPEEPCESGYVFGGWYEDEDLTTAFPDGSKMPDDDLTIYGAMRSSFGGAVYAFTADHAELLRYVPNKNESTTVWLPARVNGLPVTGIATDAFRNAQNITYLHLPDLLEDFDPEVLEDLPSLARVSIRTGNPNFRTLEGILYTADLREVLRCPLGWNRSNYTAPDDVTTVRARAFAFCENLRTVQLGENVKTIGDHSFDWCGNLVSFTADGLNSIGTDAVTNCSGVLKAYGPIRTGALRAFLAYRNGNLAIPYNQYGISLYLDGEKVNAMAIEAGNVIPASILRIDDDTGTVIHTWFTDETMTETWSAERTTPAKDMNLYAVTTPIYTWEDCSVEDENGTVTGIRLTGYSGFGGDLILPVQIDGKNVIALGSAFLAGCHGTVSSVRIGSEVIEIADTALEGPDTYPFGGIVRADEGSYAANWAASHGYTCMAGLYILAFETNGGTRLGSQNLAWNTEVRLRTPVKSGCTFAGWFTDAALNVPVTLDEGCFIMPKQDVTLYAAWSGEAVAWPYEYEEDENSITILRYTGTATTVTVPDTINGLPVQSLAAEAFRGTSVTEVTVPDSVETIGQAAFADCAALERIQIGAGTGIIGAQCFRDCPALTDILVADGNTAFTSMDGVLTAGEITLVCYPAGKAAESYTLPATITVIAAEAFRGAEKLKSVVVPDSIAAIGEYAFENCKALEAFALGENSMVSTVPAGCFSGCEVLQEVSLGSGVTAIARLAFFGCSALETLRVAAGEVSVEDNVPVFSARDMTVYCIHTNPIRSYALEHGYRVVYTDLDPTESITVIAGKTQLAVGDSTELICAVLPATAEGRTITWTSSNENAIQIIGGRAYAVYSGTAVITAASEDGVKGSLSMEVLHTHVYVAHPAREATCIDGNILYYNCPGCGLYFDEDYAEQEAGFWVLPRNHVHHTIGDWCPTCGKTFDFSGKMTLWIPADTGRIETEAFAGVPAEAIWLPDGCTILGTNAFNDCGQLQIISVPEIIPMSEVLEALGNSQPEILRRQTGE